MVESSRRARVIFSSRFSLDSALIRPESSRAIEVKNAVANAVQRLQRANVLPQIFVNRECNSAAC